MSHSKEEQTLIIFKPDALHRGLLGEILHRFERKGLKVVAMKMMTLGDAIIEEHYAHHKEKPFFPSIKKFMQSAPVVVMVLSGINAISVVRLLVGPTKGHEAPAGTIRGDFSANGQSNIVHASDSVDSAKEEIMRFFKDDEVFDYERNDFRFVYGDESF
jgi:nucleoside-diphosphate kinase